MPFSHNIALRKLTEDEFRHVDYALMGLAFAAHKELGRLCDESVYREFLRVRWVEAGHGSATAEVPITLSHFEFDTEGFCPLSNRCSLLTGRIETLLRDWGTFLEANLYLEALTHFLGGEEQVIQRIDIVDGAKILGRQRFHLIDKEISFRITSVTKDILGCQAHLQRLLSHTCLKAMHWINLNKHSVTVRTVVRDCVW